MSATKLCPECTRICIRGTTKSPACFEALVPSNGNLFQYGYPLYAYGVFLRPYNNTAQTNKLYHQRDLASPGVFAVVRPNVDTVYSVLFLDLSSSDLSFALPKFDGRYWAQSFLDL